MSLDVMGSFHYNLHDVDDAPMQDTVIDDVDMATNEYDSYMEDDEETYGADPIPTDFQELEMAPIEEEYHHPSFEPTDEHIAYARTEDLPLVDSLHQNQSTPTAFVEDLPLPPTTSATEAHSPPNYQQVPLPESNLPSQSPPPHTDTPPDTSAPDLSPRVPRPTSSQERLLPDNSLDFNPDHLVAVSLPERQVSPDPALPSSEELDHPQHSRSEIADQQDNSPPAQDEAEDLLIDTPPAVIFTVYGQNTSFSLFSLPDANEFPSSPKPTILLADQPTLYYEPIPALFDALRKEPAFQGQCENAELVLNFHRLNLKLSEDSKWAPDFSLHRLWMANFACDAGVLSIILECITPRFIERISLIEAEIEKRNNEGVAGSDEITVPTLEELYQDEEEYTIATIGEVFPPPDEYAAYEEEKSAPETGDRGDVSKNASTSSSSITIPATEPEIVSQDEIQHSKGDSQSNGLNKELNEKQDGQPDQHVDAKPEHESTSTQVSDPTSEIFDITEQVVSSSIPSKKSSLSEPTAVLSVSEHDEYDEVDNGDGVGADAEPEPLAEAIDDADYWQEDTSTLDSLADVDHVHEGSSTSRDHDVVTPTDEPEVIDLTGDFDEEEDELANDPHSASNDYGEPEVIEVNETPDSLKQSPTSRLTSTGEASTLPKHSSIHHSSPAFPSATTKPVQGKPAMGTLLDEEDLYDDTQDGSRLLEDEAEELLDYEEEETVESMSKVRAQASLSSVTSSSSIKRTFDEYDEGQGEVDPSIPTVETKRLRVEY